MINIIKCAEVTDAPEAAPVKPRWIAGLQREKCVTDLRNLAKNADTKEKREAHEYAADIISKSTLVYTAQTAPSEYVLTSTYPMHTSKNFRISVLISILLISGIILLFYL